MRNPRLVLFLLGSVLITAACNKGGGSKSSGQTGPEGPTPSHKVSECPEINGDYGIKRQNKKKIIRSQGTSSGLIFEDSETKWNIDGLNHIMDSQPKLSYRGHCADYSIFIHVYLGPRQLGEYEYSWSERGQLRIRKTSKDPQFGEEGTEVWDELDETK
jgi:hypothetical protein